VLVGGFTTNFVWCLILNVRNRRAASILLRLNLMPRLATPMISNYLFCAWPAQPVLPVFLLHHGRTQMAVRLFELDAAHGEHHHFQHALGIGLREWKGSGAHAMRLLTLSLVLLVGSTVVVAMATISPSRADVVCFLADRC